MKTARVIALLTAAAACMAQADTNVVSSVNVVGYVQTETPLAGSFDIVSLVQFSAGSNTVNIQDAIGNLDALNASATWASADKLITWNGGYVQYGLYHPSAGSNYWMANGIGWSIPAAASPANVQLERGKGVWYVTGTGGISTNMVVSGDVFLDSTFSVNLVGTLTLLSYPYSADINLTNLVVSNATASATWANADKLIVWNGGYVQYGLYHPSAGSNYWMANGIGWSIPAAASPANVTINLGKGFWYESPGGAKTIGFSKIYSVN